MKRAHPNVELDVLVCDGLDVETDGGNGGDGLVELELVEDGCKPRGQSVGQNENMKTPRSTKQGKSAPPLAVRYLTH